MRFSFSVLFLVLSIYGQLPESGGARIRTLISRITPLLLNDGTIVDDSFGTPIYQTLDGIGNNIANPRYGSTNANVTRCLPAAYEDNFNSLGGQRRPNARELSNVISNIADEESPANLNDRHLTQYAWQWGQFIDHDVTLISEDKSDDDLDDDIDVVVPCGDPTYDPNDKCDGSIHIEMFRTRQAGDENIEPTLADPRNQFNDITSFIDGSQVYGNDDARATALRLGALGRMKTAVDSSGTQVLLPYNVDGILNEVDATDRFFVGGDVRVTEQPGLLLMHTLFVRLHNNIADLLYPEITGVDRDEKTYQTTRAIVIGLIQKITYNDWLPTLFGQAVFASEIDTTTPAGIAYDDTIDPGVCAIFSSAAYRLGHTLLPFKLPLRDENCQHIFDNGRFSTDDKDIILKDGFFRPDLFGNNQDFPSALARGLACTLASEIDVLITSSVRNFLFEFIGKIHPGINLPLDLMALNLNRGRDHGLPDYNTVRESVGLPRITLFSQMTSNENLADEISESYGRNVDNVDLIIGLLAEDHLTESSFGETISRVVLRQFNRILKGDRYYYERYLNQRVVDAIKEIKFQDIIEFTTDIPDGTFNEHILDANNNIFQNTRARSIFQDVECAPDSLCSEAEKSHHHSAAAAGAHKSLTETVKKVVDHKNPVDDINTFAVLNNFSQWIKSIGIASAIIIFILFAALFITCRTKSKSNGYKTVPSISGTSTSVVE